MGTGGVLTSVESYQRPYSMTVLAQARLVMETSRSGVWVSLF
jgi:hypothetical protein